MQLIIVHLRKITYYMHMIKLNAYTVDEWLKRLLLSSDQALAEHFGLSRTSIAHYRSKNVHLGFDEHGKLKRVSNMRGSSNG